MFDFIVALLQLSYYMIFFTFIPVTLLVRFFVVKSSLTPRKKRILMIVDFTSFSFYTFMKSANKHDKIYNITLIIYAVFALLGLIYGVHMFI